MWTSLAVNTADVGEAPDELVGSYTLNLKRNDLPGHPPPELSGGVGGWTLKSLTLRPLGAQLRGGERQTRHSRRACVQRRRGSDFPDEQECATTDPGEMVETCTARTLSGPSVTFVAVSNGRPDDVMLMLPSAKPWTKAHPERLSEG
jgi:hypothetical protein